ncbi:MAG: MFS transporter [Parvularculaceae bacterium]
MGNTILFAVLPPLARSVGLHDFQVLSIFMVSALFWVTFSPIWGRLSDQHGRRRFILMGYAAFAASTTLFALALDAGRRGALAGLALYGSLIAARAAWGLIGSASAAVGQAYIADRTPPSRRASGLAAFTAAFGLGAMLGPAFAGAVASVAPQWGPVAPVYAVAGAALCAVVAIAVFLKERTAPTTRPRAPAMSPLDPRVRGLLILGFAVSVATGAQTQFTTFFYIDRIAPPGASETALLEGAGVALSASAGAALFAQLALVRGFNLRPALLMRAGPIALALGHVVIAFSTSLGAFAFGALLGGLGAGLAAPGFVGGASLAVTDDEQGAVSGLANAATASSFVVGPPVAYALYALAPQFLFAATAGVAAGAAAYAIIGGPVGALRRAHPPQSANEAPD